MQFKYIQTKPFCPGSWKFFLSFQQCSYPCSLVSTLSSETRAGNNPVLTVPASIMLFRLIMFLWSQITSGVPAEAAAPGAAQLLTN